MINTIESKKDENISEFNTPNEKIINREHITFIDDNQPLNMISVEKDHIEEESNPLDDYRMSSYKAAYTADGQYALRGDAGIAIAPRENKTQSVRRTMATYFLNNLLCSI